MCVSDSHIPRIVQSHRSPDLSCRAGLTRAGKTSLFRSTQERLLPVGSDELSGEASTSPGLLGGFRNRHILSKGVREL